MKTLPPSEIRQLVAKAFVIEAVTDKPGCTTRYEDLADKPLQDFIMAGINSSEAFGLFTKAFIDDANTPIYSYNVIALKSANKHKSAKYINFGLLEIMFPVVAARLTTNKPEDIINKVIELTKKTTSHDVRYLLETRNLAWSTSQTPHKIAFDPNNYKNLDSIWDFYMAMFKDFPSESSNFQWAKQYKEGLPILKSFFDAYLKSNEILQTTKSVFIKQKEANPKAAVGIIADMCAAAIFLWLSFNETAI